MSKAKSAPKRAGKRANPVKKKKRSSFQSKATALLFVLLILIAVAITMDFVLYKFGVAPICAVETAAEGGGTEHIGLLYTVTERAGEPLRWEWIWQKLFAGLFQPSEG